LYYGQAELYWSQLGHTACGTRRRSRYGYGRYVERRFFTDAVTPGWFGGSGLPAIVLPERRRSYTLTMPTLEQPGDQQRQTQASDRAANGDRKQIRPDPPPTHHWLERIDTIAKLALSLAGLLLSAVIGFATIHYNQLAAQRQIQSQIESLEQQRRATAAQMLVSQLPIVLRGKEQDRALTLKLLEVVDPDLVRQIGEKLLAHADSPAAVEQAKQVIASSVTTAHEYAVAQHVENARKYREFSLYPEAAREYMKACEALPRPTRERLAKRIVDATKDYDSGNYSGAVQTFEEVFRDVKAPFSE
jgi:hypothetical protein